MTVLLEGLVVALALVCIASLGYAAWLWLTSQYTPQYAALFAGLGAAALGLVLSGGLWFARNRRKIKYYLGYKKISGQAEGIVSSLMQEWEAPIKDHPKTAAALAVIAGVILATFLEKKGTLLDIFQFDPHARHKGNGRSHQYGEKGD